MNLHASSSIAYLIIIRLRLKPKVLHILSVLLHGWKCFILNFKLIKIPLGVGHVSLALENEVGGTWGRKSTFSMLTYRTFLNCNNRTVPKWRFSDILSEGSLQAEASEHFAVKNYQRNHAF